MQELSSTTKIVLVVGCSSRENRFLFHIAHTFAPVATERSSFSPYYLEPRNVAFWFLSFISQICQRKSGVLVFSSLVARDGRHKSASGML